MDLEKRSYCVESLKTAELLLKELLLESKERTNACLKLHEAALWVESIPVEGGERSLTAELFSSRKNRRGGKKGSKRQDGSPRSAGSL